jgi:hypothetical protein
MVQFKSFVNFFICFSMLFSIGMLLIIFLGAMRFILPLFNSSTLDGKLFYSGVLIAISSGIMLFFQSFLKEFIDSFKYFAKDKKEVK